MPGFSGLQLAMVVFIIKYVHVWMSRIHRDEVVVAVYRVLHP